LRVELLSMLFEPVHRNDQALADCVIDAPITAENSISIAVSKPSLLLELVVKHLRLKISLPAIGQSPILRCVC